MKEIFTMLKYGCKISRFGSASVLLAAMIAGCSDSNTVEAVDINNKDVVISDVVASNEIFLFGGDSQVKLIAEAGNKAVESSDGTVLSSIVTDPLPGGRTGGASLQIPMDLELKVRGRPVEISILAKAPFEKPTEMFSAAYSTAMNGNSGWTSFKPSSEFVTYTFKYDVPDAPAREANYDYIGIHADISGNGDKLIVKNIKLKILEE